MGRKLLVFFCLIACLITILFFMINEFKEPTLTETVKIEKKKEDFIVHIRIEPLKEGFQVLRSIEYTGEESIEIKHRTPLTKITMDVDNAFFTGSTMKKEFGPKHQYYPLTPLTYNSLEKGEHKIYVHTQFWLKEERVDIKMENTIYFE